MRFARVFRCCSVLHLSYPLKATIKSTPNPSFLAETAVGMLLGVHLPLGRPLGAMLAAKVIQSLYLHLVRFDVPCPRSSPPAGASSSSPSPSPSPSVPAPSFSKRRADRHCLRAPSERSRAPELRPGRENRCSFGAR